MYEPQDIVEVKPKDAALVKRNDEIVEKAWNRAEEEAKEASVQRGKKLEAVMAFVDNPDERRIVEECGRLAKDFQLAKDLPRPPVLIPPLISQSYNSFLPVEDFHRYRRKDGSPLSQIALVDLFIERVLIRRWDDSLYVWSGTHYAKMSDTALKGLIKEVLREELYYTNASSTINAILALLQSESRIRAAVDASSMEIALQNGVIDVETMHFHSASPEIFNTHFLDISWYGKAPCPIFQSFIWFVSGGDEVLYCRILETIGFLLSPGNQAKRFVIFQGERNSGKSVLGNLIQSFFAPGDFSSLPLHQFGDRFAMSALADRHLNVSMDLPDGLIDSKAAATIKQITGGDQVFVEGKGKDGYAKQIQCKLLFGSNHPVELKKNDAAFADRILRIPFNIPVTPDQKDTNLLERLLEEKPGILYTCLEAYRGVVQRNYQFTGEEQFGFKLQEVVLPVQPAESVTAFLSQCCQIEPDSFLSVEQLHQAFETFCSSTGLPSIADRSAFSRAFRTCLGNQVKATKRRVGGVPLNGYIGIKFKDKTN